MRLRSIPLIAATAAALMLSGTAAATAATAYASTTVNVRAGAGSGYAVVDVLHPGERVEVNYCKGAWCAVEKPGPDGWVNANYLTSGRDYNDDEYDYYDDDEPDFIIMPPRSRVHFWPYYHSQACVGSEHAQFCISD